jgi:hypothetical protein
MKKNLFLTIAATLGLTAVTMAQNVPSYVSTNGLIGWWPFNGNANDESGNGNNGTVNGATLTTDRFGNVNNAYNFDGVDDYNEIDVNSLLQNGLSISVWIRSNLPNSQSDWKGIVWSRLSGPAGNPPFSPDQATGIMVYPGGLLGLASDGNSLVQLQDMGQYSNDSLWYHIVFSYNLNTGFTQIYVNGSETINMTSTSLSAIDFAFNTIKIGKDEITGYGNRHWCGKIDDIGIWNRALTACEIQDLYSSQLNSSAGINAGNDITVCQGDQVTLSGSGGSDYNWSGGINNNTPFVPSTSQDYVLTALSTNGCLGIDTVSVTVNQNSTATLNETGLDSVNVNGIWYDQNGQYTQVIPNAAGCDSTITINVSLSFTGVSELSGQYFSIFPNPATSIIQVKADAELLGMSYSIYDNRGKVVLRGKLNAENTSISLNNLSDGIYMLSIGENMKHTFKVIKE